MIYFLMLHSLKKYYKLKKPFYGVNSGNLIGGEIPEIRFKNVYPTSLGSLSYDIKAGDVDYLTVSSSFNYLNYDIVQVSTT